MKAIMISVCHSFESSINILRIKTMSAHDLLGRKPCCSSLNMASTFVWMWFKSTLQRTSLPADCRVIPRQLLQSATLPFLISFNIYPFFQSVGISSVSYICINTSCSGSASTPTPYFNSSGCIRSMPAAFPFFSLRSTVSISYILIASVLMSNFKRGRPSGGSAGRAKFNILWKYYFHLLSISLLFDFD